MHEYVYLGLEIVKIASMGHLRISVIMSILMYFAKYTLSAIKRMNIFNETAVLM